MEEGGIAAPAPSRTRRVCLLYRGPTLRQRCAGGPQKPVWVASLPDPRDHPLLIPRGHGREGGQIEFRGEHLLKTAKIRGFAILIRVDIGAARLQTTPGGHHPLADNLAFPALKAQPLTLALPRGGGSVGSLVGPFHGVEYTVHSSS
jgi:hypothetical protein